MVDASRLERNYKDHLSGFRSWDQLEHASDWILLPENMGTRLSIDETSLCDDLFTILSSKDGNVTQNCRSLLYNCNDCIVAAEGDKVVAVWGLQDYIVADTDNALLICPIEAEQRIRNIVNDIRERFGPEYT